MSPIRLTSSGCLSHHLPGVSHHLKSSLFGGALLEDEMSERLVCLFTLSWWHMVDRPTTAIITDHYATICKAVGLIFQRDGIGIACVMLGNTRSSTFRDITHGIRTSVMCISPIHPPPPPAGLRLDGSIFVRSIMLSPCVGYEQCMRNVNSG